MIEKILYFKNSVYETILQNDHIIDYMLPVYVFQSAIPEEIKKEKRK